MVCPYASCIDCCISYSNSACASPDLVGGGGGAAACCWCILLQFVLILVLTTLQLLLVVLFFKALGARCKCSTCTHGDHHPLQLALVDTVQVVVYYGNVKTMQVANTRVKPYQYVM